MSPKRYRDIQDAAHDWIGLSLTGGQVEDLLARNPEWADNVAEWGVGTREREELADIMTREILGRGRVWPCYGDSQASKDQFFKDFYEAAVAAGYRVVENR